MNKSVLLLSASSLFFLSGCFLSDTENQYPVTEKNTPYTLEYVQKSDKVIVEEFSDLECPACKGFSKVYDRIEKDFPEVEFRYYHYPLEQIHDFAFPGALATECVSEIAGPKARQDYIHAVFAEPKLSIDFFRKLAKKQNIDEEKFNECFAEKKTKSIIKAHIKEGNERGLTATPTLFFNGEKVTGGMRYDDMYAKIQKLIDEKK